MSFETLGLNPALTRALADAGYEQPTEVQAQAVPPALQGADLRVSSSTGSGKTASFALPALQRVLNARGDGKRREKGMASFADLVSKSDAEAVHAYLIHRANEDWAKVQAGE